MPEMETTADHENTLRIANKSVSLRRTLGFFDGTCFLVGIIVGAGIFVSPTGVLQYAQLNVGVALCIWAACGILVMMGALCYAELGSALPYAGGEYYHVKQALGPFPAFIFIWTLILFIRPASNAARALMFAEYATRPFFSGCPTPELLKKIVALAVLWVLGIINTKSAKTTTWVQNVFTVLKMLALILIVTCGLKELAEKTEIPGHLQNAFSSPDLNAAQIAESFFQGLYAYGGWNYLNYIAEEIKNPTKNIPLCTITAVSVVIVFYLLVNISYLTVLTPKEIVSSAAVSVTWADRVIPMVAWIIPVSVAISIFGALNGGMFMLGRLNYAGSKEGHLPSLLSMLHVNHLTPAPAMILSTIIASIFVIPSDLLSLTNYFGFSTWLLVGLTVISLIVLRYREPNLPRPYKVFLPIAFGVVLVAAFLVLAPIIQSPKVQYFYALLFMLSSMIIYFPFVYFKLRVPYFNAITCYLQLLMEVAPTDIFEDPKSK
ncbi:b(0,+)-type amino acid transporter 1 [Xenopus tropicalis]|uniref:B(0,+)-type amino acid transporter 1 n=1 Tax=Xenopus tropicalis TaxID=8364 RepID=A0A6I8SE79_XENTR|nr:b(0,+)-type amino acid transporter 1 [Xenopus tropicalis]|eukprot:XP_002941804.3 PREDICTED: b(0,+)-type amino acid transporter 1-like [Xenopus tropicalis]